MGLPFDTALCPTCGATLPKPPQRKTRCPHCGDYLYVKYHPGQTRDDRQIVGSKEAAAIDHEWERQNQIERDIRYAGYAEDREQTILRMLNETFPPGVVMFYVQFVGPLRDGDLIEVRECHDKKLYPRVVDRQRNAIVALSEWHRQAPIRAPIELLIRSFVDGSSIQLIDAESGFAKDHNVRIPDNWTQPWLLQSGTSES